ncbi:hypothetical protein EDD18DRAFT_1335299 [Armillaria luteobubalina]|uniref:HMG box domain-containing protein n=1 Tax=Armillaria luteobubalina TaxID=153913 RepID=A0AA39PPA0_9AGAR|nr:hypothetical protein EDD18DRAFT_1335299 [Armillaria luteobubalina]
MAPYVLFPGDLALAHNSGSLTPPATRTSNATASLPTYAAAQRYQTLHRRSPRPRDAFTIFLHVFTAQYKNRLPAHRTEVRLIALPIWDGLAREERLFYETLARQEREFCERGHTTPALQRRVSARDGGSRNSRERQMVLNRSVAGRDQPHWPVAQVDPQAFVNRFPIMTPTAADENLRIQYPSSSIIDVMDVSTDVVAHNVCTTEGQAMIDLQHGQATQGMPTSHQWLPSISIPPVVTESSISDSLIHDSVPYYRDISGQSFLITNQSTTPQYLPSAPVVAPIAHRPNDHPPTEKGPPTEMDHPLTIGILLRAPGMVSKTLNTSSGHQLHYVLMVAHQQSMVDMTTCSGFEDGLAYTAMKRRGRNEFRHNSASKTGFQRINQCLDIHMHQLYPARFFLAFWEYGCMHDSVEMVPGWDYVL